MARLRSAEPSIASPTTPKSALDRIVESSTKLDSDATPATFLGYPSLEGLEHPLDKVEYPKIALTTPKAASRIPTYAATTGKKLRSFSEKEVSTLIKPVQKLKVPSTGFEFRVIKTGEKKVEELTAPTMATTTTPARPIAKKKSRFSDAHRRQFEKMESITTHYAAKRTPKQPVTVEKIPRGVKRTKSRAELGDRGPPSSPSPVKMHVDGQRNAEGEGGSPMKRAKMSATYEEKTMQANKPTGIPRLCTTPMKGLKRRPATASKISMGGRLNLTPATRLASTVQAGGTPSKIPTAVTTPVVEDTDSAPTTAAAPLKQPVKLPSNDTPKKATNPLAPPKTDGFTFRSKGAGTGYKSLSDMHSLNYNLKQDTSAAITPLLTPMKMSSEDPFVGMARRAAIEWTPVTAEKRKAPDDNEEDAADTAQEGGARKKLKFAPEEPAPAPAPAPAPSAAEAAATSIKKKKTLLNRGKAILKRSRLNVLAMPKRRAEHDTEAAASGGKDNGRQKWK